MVGQHESGYCSVDGCMNRRSNKELTFFKLPKEEDRRKEWLKLIGRPDLLEREQLKHGSYRICSAHFDDTVIQIVKKLESHALPSKNLPNEPISCSNLNVLDKSTKTGLKKKKNVIDYSLRVPQCRVWKKKKNRKKSKILRAPSKTKLQLIINETKTRTKKDFGNKYEKIKVELEVEHLKTEIEDANTEVELIETEVNPTVIKVQHAETEVELRGLEVTHNTTRHIETKAEHTIKKGKNKDIKVAQETQVKHTIKTVQNTDIEVAHMKTEVEKENIIKLNMDNENQEIMFEEIEFEPMYIKEEIIDDTEEMQEWPLTLYPFKNKYFN